MNFALQRDPKEALGIFYSGTDRPPVPVSQVVSFIKRHRVDFGVDSMCKVLPITPSIYYQRIAIGRDPNLASDRVKSDKID